MQLTMLQLIVATWDEKKLVATRNATHRCDIQGSKKKSCNLEEKIQLQLMLQHEMQLFQKFICKSCCNS
jgi:hypothetical protein